MQLIAHRGAWFHPAEQNTLAAITRALDLGWGIETDLRSHRGALYLSHDPIVSPGEVPKFDDLIPLMKAHPTRHFFLNIKEDGMTPLLWPHLSFLEESNSVFFDYSIPEMFQYSKVFSRRHLATRFGDLELNPSALELCEWIWVDGLTRDVAGAEIEFLLKRHRHNLAVVSPELHHRDPKTMWEMLKTLKADPRLAALCTDLPSKW